MVIDGSAWPKTSAISLGGTPARTTGRLASDEVDRDVGTAAAELDRPATPSLSAAPIVPTIAGVNDGARAPAVAAVPELNSINELKVAAACAGPLGPSRVLDS
jgi:hypothetical protein